ncbi:hypothetical protein N7462_002592 [Penicillium macrosclerotiorum]|uniref:uncharacterized protein n=1 Tax=Penicillium macrosclerotiorum TaxID=303699 RepID=UPI0025485A7D|nr:uncharacterized protein N7462_002592 [Penicillium macrosclerotiorum]KAJ5693169.1 hypothetical protein N7462_002592 [Penicillium macrosclerotiorum]
MARLKSATPDVAKADAGYKDMPRLSGQSRLDYKHPPSEEVWCWEMSAINLGCLCSRWLPPRLSSSLSTPITLPDHRVARAWLPPSQTEEAPSDFIPRLLPQYQGPRPTEWRTLRAMAKTKNSLRFLDPVPVSPKNEILLLHRVQTSSSFASAHVFPGGNLSDQDGPCPPPEDHSRHEDGPHYRRAAIRELFEESGILLARNGGSGKMLAVDEAGRDQGRRLIHQNQVTFETWLGQQNENAEPDIDRLIPFTRWVTPTNVPKRYTTQMYLYFMPLPVNINTNLLKELPAEGEREEIQVPTSDGGIEVTEAQFLPASEWLRRAQSGEIILFPPQFLLLHLVSEIMDKEPRAGISIEEMEKRRAALVEFVHSGSPAWTHKCISPKMMKMTDDGRAVLALDEPGPELKGSARRGESDYVVLVRFKKGSAREVTVAWKRDVFREGREDRSNL